MKFTGISFVIAFAWIFLFSSCSIHPYVVHQSQFEKNISIDETLGEDEKIKKFIEPYKKRLDSEMDRVLSYVAIDLHKDGFNSPLANLNCDLVLEETNQRFGKTDICLLNHGGIRRTFTKGNLTVKNIYEWMPFENQAVIVTLSGNQIIEMVKFLSESSKGHPISGIKFEANNPNSIEIQGKKFDINQTYKVVTNDYLQKGGDEMYFLSNPIKLEETNLKLRDMMLDYFEKNDSIIVNLEDRILK